MGLDTVELVMAFEEEFGVAISNADAETLQTPGDVIDFVDARIGEAVPPDFCWTRNGFHIVRKRMIDVGFPRSAIRPEAPLELLFPLKDRRRQWEAASDSISAWPRLHLPAGVERAIMPFAISFAIAAAWFNWHFMPALMAKWLGQFPLTVRMTTDFSTVGAFVISLIAGAALFYKLTERWCIRFGPLVTVGDLARAVAGSENQTWAHETKGRHTRAHIAERVRALTLDQLGLDRSEYGENKTFVGDFGAD